MQTKVDYFKIIDKYIKNPKTLHIYLTHVTLVTARALKIANGLNLSPSKIRFIEEAAMLHDIGIANVKDEELYCDGDLSYICHITEGRKMLESEGLHEHALVAERHTGVGITEQEILQLNLPLPLRNMIANSIEEKIISWSDLFYSKDPDNLFVEKSLSEAYDSVIRYGEDKKIIFNEWKDLFARYH